MSANAQSYSAPAAAEEPEDEQPRRNEWRMHGHWTSANRRIFKDGEHKADPVAQLGVYRQLDRVWCRYLSLAERNLLHFFVDQTIGWGKQGQHFTHRQIEEGNGSTAGAGIGRTQSKKVIKSLEAKGFISVDRYDLQTDRGGAIHGNYIEVNIEWEPTTPVTKVTPSDASGQMSAPTPVGKVTPLLRKTTPLPVTKVTPSRSQKCPPVVANEPPFKEETYQEKPQKNEKNKTTEESLLPETATERFSDTIFSPAPVRLRQRPASPAKENPTPIAAAPLKADELDERLLASFTEHCPRVSEIWPDNERRAAADFLAVNWAKVCPEGCLAYEFADWLGESWSHWHDQRVMPAFPSVAWLNAEGQSFVNKFLDQ